MTNEEIKNAELKADAPIYVVVHSGGCGEEAPKYNGAAVVGLYTGIEAAEIALARVAAEWAEYFEDGAWKPGYCDDKLGAKWAANYYADNGHTAWTNGDEANWQRVEIFTQDGYGGWKAVL